MVASKVPLLPGHGQRIIIHGMSAGQLIAAAYRVPQRDVVGPSWIFDARFDIDALIPAGQGRDKAPDMLRTLLEQRLALKGHRVVRKMSGYVLSVDKDGPKLKEAPPFKPTENLSGQAIRRGTKYSGLTEDLGHCDMA